MPNLEHYRHLTISRIKHTKMKSAIRRNYGSPEVIKIEKIEKPVPKDNEVLIRVFATTVNRTDCANLTA